MGALSAPVLNAADPEMVEALAAVKAVQFARDMGFTRIVLEGNAASIISSHLDLSSAGVILEEAKVLMGSMTLL
ncbi:hypothetical protein PTKIN_Ptkin03bG0206900 [Pterospermum kingtungense]